MPSGAAPGERRGGRSRGVPNKKDVVKHLVGEVLDGTDGQKRIKDVVARELAKMAQPPRNSRKAIDILDTLMQLSMGLVARYQPRPDGGMETNPQADETKFQTYLPIALNSAKELAKYQSPTFKAIALQEVPAAPAAAPGDDAKVVNAIEKGSQQRASDAYVRLIRGKVA